MMNRSYLNNEDEGNQGNREEKKHRGLEHALLTSSSSSP